MTWQLSLQYVGAVTLVIGTVAACGLMLKHEPGRVLRLALINWCLFNSWIFVAWIGAALFFVLSSALSLFR